MTGKAEHFIGLMSGTSADSIDAALIRIESARITLLETYTAGLATGLRAQILNANADQLPLSHYAALDHALGECFASAAHGLLRLAKMDAAQVRAIGCHGQTVWHTPDGPRANSLQIGDPNVVAERTGICTVADFRRRDMAAGGQGAPLVPAFHEVMFRQPGLERGVLNIGGIANLTILPAYENIPVTGFDTGPGNALCDEWVSVKLGHAFDQHGNYAASGTPVPELLAGWLKDNYFSLPPPKSTGRDHFRLAQIADLAKLEQYPGADVQATLLELSAQSIAHAVRGADRKLAELLLCGGGVNNDCLVRKLAQLLPEVSLRTTDALGAPGEYLEAMAFAWLACCRLSGRAAGLQRVTGARHDSVLGAVYPGG